MEEKGGNRKMSYKEKRKFGNKEYGFVFKGQSFDKPAFFKTKEEIEDWKNIRKKQGWDFKYRTIKTDRGYLLYVRQK